ncbi:MAG: polysaccharide deacetylase family protein [Gammaproteobacteria bacterium]|nr:polysaccharide deacetylase family protein [Gammaproteobacteria bacterium]
MIGRLLGALLAALLAPAGASRAAAGLLDACWTPDELRDGQGRGALPHAAASPDAVVAPLPPLPARLQGSIRAVHPAGDEKVIALTFDLCEGARGVSGYDAPLVAYLREQGVRATFFAGGKWLRSHPEPALQLMADPRFEIGSHSWSHKDFDGLPAAARDDEIAKAQTEYARLRAELAGRACAVATGPAALAAIPPQPALFRFPYGRCDRAALDALAAAGLPAIQWSIVTGDPAKGQGAAAIARAILDRTRPGAIVVMHANGRGWHTAEALRTAIPELRRRGYRFVTVSELLALGEPVTADRCYE